MSATDGEEECLNFVEQLPDPTNSPVAIVIFTIVYVNIFVLGLVGNLSIIWLTLRYAYLRTVQNIFILNLAISDVIVCLLSLPFTPVTNIYKNWLFGPAICHLLPFVQAVSVFVSTFSLSAIAVDRYCLVTKPHAKPLSLRSATVIAVILWVLSVVVSLPYGYYMTLEEYPGYCGEFCSEHWPTQPVRRIYTFIALTVQFLIPFVTMTFCYSSIFARLKERADSKLKKINERKELLSTRSLAGDEKLETSETFPVDEKRRAQLLARQRRTTTILASMVLIFGLTWLPQNVVSLIIEYDESALQSGPVNYTYLVSLIVHSIAMTTNVANPILYAWLNPQFKALFLQMITRSKKSLSPQRSLNGYTTLKRPSVAQVNIVKEPGDVHV